MRRAPAHGVTWRDVLPLLAPPPRSAALAGWALLPLRAFLGVTFCFAGLQKLANPAFFRASNPTSIQAQLAGAARRSPVHAFVAPLQHVAVPLGVAIAFAELAVGLATLLGLWTRIAAAGGVVLALFLFLTVSFHASPYYTGSDIVFAFAWLPLVVAGAGGVLSADVLLSELARARDGAEPAVVVPVPFAAVRQACGAFEDGRCTLRRNAPCEPGPCPWLLPRRSAARRSAAHELDRRTFAAQGALAAVAAFGALLAGGVAAAAGRLAGGARSSGSAPSSLGAGSPSSTTTSGPNGTTSGSTPSTTTGGGSPPAGSKIGPASAVPVGGAAQFTDPTSGDPSLVVQPRNGTFLAFDAVCPHAGCIVQYDPGGKLFVCPCHGSQFNGHTGAVETGPAPTGLTRIGITKGSDGQLYVT